MSPDQTGAEPLTSRAFAASASEHSAIVDELSLRLIHESDLPADWLETTVGCYSIEAEYYALAQYADTGPLKSAVNDHVAESLAAVGARRIVDVGVGDGHRISGIATRVAERTGHRPLTFGIELSREMSSLARSRGVTVVEQDMRAGIPDFGDDLDAVLLLSGDLGFVMDPVDGPRLRVSLLDSAHERLRPGGVVVLELVSREPRRAPNGADVFHFSRAPRVRGAGDESQPDVRGPETWQFIKTFTQDEFTGLVAASRFAAAHMSTAWIVRASEHPDRVGSFVPRETLRADESYRLLAVLTK